MLRIAAVLAMAILFHAPADAAGPDCYRGSCSSLRSLLPPLQSTTRKCLFWRMGCGLKACPSPPNFRSASRSIKLCLMRLAHCSTSYRRNGPIIDEAIEDVLQLRDFAITKYGRPDKIYLMGTSMGGAIGARISETCKGKFDGILCIGPALYLCPALSGQPAVPMLFLCNRSEVEKPRAYIGLLHDNAVRPAFWTVGATATAMSTTMKGLRLSEQWRPMLKPAMLRLTAPSRSKRMPLSLQPCLKTAGLCTGFAD